MQVTRCAFFAFDPEKMLPEVYVEKEYWVTRVLLQLSQSGFRGDFVFKGSTVISRVSGIIKRFSGDADLARYDNQWRNGNQIKTCMRAAEQTISVGLRYVRKPGESKGSQFRKVCYKLVKVMFTYIKMGPAGPTLISSNV
ncbi:nucleotidyl transferase AbiEii/AbiGii toxin family protein [[Erwinia] mediterraneensis]|uniref:nucleotidyl transferase AbiEii/AbiGii toxin family protein n=1 Tax=[Erwinia] mediterraneensis TaxID=2161819 RepID=UPI00102F98FC|nr:nucleotidyl transferase AbiEii/AbiGii toxin family protein [[Erwinia] mediterraneensis]